MWDSENENSIFENDPDEPDQPKSPEISVHSDVTNNETYNIAVRTHQSCPETHPQVDVIHDGTNTDHDNSWKRDTNSEHHNPNSTNTGSKKMIYVLAHSPIAMTIRDTDIPKTPEFFPSIP